MKILIPIFTALILINSCKSENSKVIEGDLYFKIIDFPSFFGAPDSLVSKFETEIKTLNVDTLNEKDREEWGLLKFLYDEKLMAKPFIKLRQDNGEISMIYLDSIDYIKLKDYNRNDLLKENKKIRIKAKVSPIQHDTFHAYINLDSIAIQKIEGKTYWMK